jgi:hypothetical protein
MIRWDNAKSPPADESQNKKINHSGFILHLFIDVWLSVTPG